VHGANRGSLEDAKQLDQQYRDFLSHLGWDHDGAITRVHKSLPDALYFYVIKYSERACGHCDTWQPNNKDW
jgi:hypothetical protein